MEGESSKKKQKTSSSEEAGGSRDVEGSRDSVFNPKSHLFCPTGISEDQGAEGLKGKVDEALMNQFNSSKPFRHTVVNNFLEPSFCREIWEEIREKLHGKFKETDLFKFFQTKDITALLAADQAQDSPSLPCMARLVEELYSEKFRKELALKFGLGELCERVDMAVQAYTNGCHLMCHDDVISTRKLTFVLYLADPDDKPWQSLEGGGMEFYEEGNPIPTGELLPDFNVALFFGVEPSKSYHAVREVASPEERVRLSLQGWFHAPSLEDTFSYELRSRATLQELLAPAESGEELLPTPAEGEAEAPAPTSEKDAVDFPLLRKYINAEYLSVKGQTQLNEYFAENSAMMLNKFLKEEYAQEFMEMIREVDRAEDAEGILEKTDQGTAGIQDYYSQGITKGSEISGWKICGPAHMQRYLQFEQSSGSESSDTPQDPNLKLGSKFAELRDALLLRTEFQQFLEKISGLKIPSMEKKSLEIRRFRRGRDYTIATMNRTRKEAKLDICLMFADDGSPEKKAVWESEEVGGFESYIEVDEEEDDQKAEVYRENEEDGPLLNISPSSNTLSVVMRDAKTLSFIKFVSSAAPSSRADIKLVYNIEDDGGEEQNEED